MDLDAGSPRAAATPAPDEPDWAALHALAAARARRAAEALCAASPVEDTLALPDELAALADRLDDADESAETEVRAALMEALRAVEAR